MRKVAVPDSLILATAVLIGADMIATYDRVVAAVARELVGDVAVLSLADVG